MVGVRLPLGQSVLYKCRPKPQRYIRQVVVCKGMSSCERDEVVCLLLVYATSRKVAKLSIDVALSQRMCIGSSFTETMDWCIPLHIPLIDEKPHHLIILHILS